MDQPKNHESHRAAIYAYMGIEGTVEEALQKTVAEDMAGEETTAAKDSHRDGSFRGAPTQPVQARDRKGRLNHDDTRRNLRENADRP